MVVNRLNDILATLGELALEEFTSGVRAACTQHPPLRGFTPHDASHFSGVEQTLSDLLKHQKQSIPKADRDQGQPPSVVEDLILHFCCWGHDVGMLRAVSEEYHAKVQSKHEGKPWSIPWAREFHDEASAYYVVDKLQGIAERVTLDHSVSVKVSERSDEIKLGEAKSNCEHRQDLLRKKLKHLDEQLVDGLIRYLETKENHNAVKAHFTALAHTVTLVASFHRRRKNLDLCPTSRDVLGVPVRARMLAAIFRLADAFHVDRTRFSPEEFEALRYQPDFSPESRRHWMKSILVSSISIVEESHAVDVQLDLPESIVLDTLHPRRPPEPQKKGRETMIAGMRDFIVNDLEEDVLSVSGILLEYSFPPLLRVRSRVHSVPTMVYTDEIWRVLEDLNAAASPNTSQLINSALGSLLTTYTGDHAMLIRELAWRLESLRDMLEQRPCHEGLKKIRSLLEAIYQMFNDKHIEARAVIPLIGTECITDVGLVKVCMEGARSTFREQRDKCKSTLESGIFDDILKGFDNIVVYGFSDQALEVLRRIVDHLKESPTLYVLECRTKTQHTATGRLIYNDGSRYALSIREKLPQAARIFLVPDSAVGRILNSMASGDRTLVLLGSNAITLDGSLVHSMGHISVAAAAKCPLYSNKKTSVYVLTDGLKIGGTCAEVKAHEDDERNKRYWLTADAATQDALRIADVQTVNWMEDMVPSELIDKILVLDIGKTISAAANDFQDDLRTSEFEVMNEFCDKLHTRIVAHNTREQLDLEMANHQDLLQLLLKSKANRPGNKNLDVLCYVIAEKALKDELRHVNDVPQELWVPLREAAEKAVTPEVQNAIVTFVKELKGAYQGRSPRSKALRRGPDSDFKKASGF